MEWWALVMIAEERDRQVSKENWSFAHDDEHTDGSLGMAAACYAAPEPIFVPGPRPCGCRSVGECTHFSDTSGRIDAWPWSSVYDKRRKHDRMRQLQIAGALIIAEMARLRRSEKQQHEPVREGEK